MQEIRIRAGRFGEEEGAKLLVRVERRIGHFAQSRVLELELRQQRGDVGAQLTGRVARRRRLLLRLVAIVGDGGEQVWR